MTLCAHPHCTSPVTITGKGWHRYCVEHRLPRYVAMRESAYQRGYYARTDGRTKMLGGGTREART